MSDDRPSVEPIYPCVRIEDVVAAFQSEYDRHMASYRKGCRGCIGACYAIRDLAKKLKIPIEESI